VESPIYHSGALNFVTTFSEPALALPYAGATLQRAVFLALRDYGLDLAGLQESKVHTGPTGWFLSASFLSFAAELKVRVDGLEVNFISEHPQEIGSRKPVLDAIERAVLQADGHASASRRVLIRQTHCELSDEGVRERIPPPVRSFPDSLGAPAGQAIGLYFTDSLLFSGRANIVLDRSAVLDQGMFVQVRCEFDADQYDLMTSIDNFHECLSLIEEAFDLRGVLGGKV
jgi:hypothetical protein